MANYRIDYTTDSTYGGRVPDADLRWEPVATQPGIDYTSLRDVLALRDDLEAISDGKGRYRVVELPAPDPAANEDILEAALLWREADQQGSFTGLSSTSALEALRRAVDYRLRLQRDGERRVA